MGRARATRAARPGEDELNAVIGRLAGEGGPNPWRVRSFRFLGEFPTREAAVAWYSEVSRQKEGNDAEE